MPELVRAVYSPPGLPGRGPRRVSQARSHPDTLRMPKHTRGAPGALTYTAQTRWLVTEVIVRVVQQEVVLEVVEQEMAYLEGRPGCDRSKSPCCTARYPPVWLVCKKSTLDGQRGKGPPALRAAGWGLDCVGVSGVQRPHTTTSQYPEPKPLTGHHLPSLPTPAWQLA